MIAWSLKTYALQNSVYSFALLLAFAAEDAAEDALILTLQK